MGMAAVQWRKVSIADSASLSGAIDMTGLKLVIMRQGANVEGTFFSFQASFDGGVTFEDLFAVGEDQTGTVGTLEYSVAKSATLPQVLQFPNTFYIYGPTHLKVRTGLTGAATTQTGAADVWLGFEDVEAVNS